MSFLLVLLILLPFLPEVVGLIVSLLLRIVVSVAAFTFLRKPAFKEWKIKSRLLSLVSFLCGFFGRGLTFERTDNFDECDSKDIHKVELSLGKIRFRSIRWNLTSLTFQGIQIKLRTVIYIAESSGNTNSSEQGKQNIQRLEFRTKLKIDEIKLSIAILEFFRTKKQQHGNSMSKEGDEAKLDENKSKIEGKKLTGISKKIMFFSRFNAGVKIQGIALFCNTHFSSTNMDAKAQSNSNLEASFFADELSLRLQTQKQNSEEATIAIMIPLSLQGLTLNVSSHLLKDNQRPPNPTSSKSNDPISLKMQSTIIHFTLYPYKMSLYTTMIPSSSSNNKMISLQSHTNLKQLSNTRFVLVECIAPTVKAFLNRRNRAELHSKKVNKDRKKNTMRNSLINELTIDISVVMELFISGLEHECDKSFCSELHMELGTIMLINCNHVGGNSTNGISQIQEKLDPTLYRVQAVDNKSTRIEIDEVTKLTINLSNTFIRQINSGNMLDRVYTQANVRENDILWIDRSILTISKSRLKSYVSCEQRPTLSNDYTTLIEGSPDHLIVMSTKAIIGKAMLSSDANTTDTLACTAALLKKHMTPSSKSNYESVKLKKKVRSVVSHVDVVMDTVTIALELLPFGKDEIDNLSSTHPLMEEKFSNDTSYNADAKDLRICFFSRSPTLDSIFFTFLKGEKHVCKDGMVTFQSTNTGVSVLFTPSINLPEMASSDVLDNNVNESNKSMKRVKFWLTAKRLDTEIKLPGSFPLNLPVLENETIQPFGPEISLKLESLILKENVEIESHLPSQEDIIFDCSGALHFRLGGTKYEDPSLLSEMGRNGIYVTTVINQIDIQTMSPTLYVTWSPIFMWFLLSVLQRTECAVGHYGALFANQKGKVKTKRSLTNINIKSNTTLVFVRAVLCKGSIIDIFTENLQFSITNSLEIFWNKPNIRLESGMTSASFNGNRMKVLELSSLVFNNSFSIAPDVLIKTYLGKKKNHDAHGTELTKEIMTDGLDRPILETFEILLGDSVDLKLPHDLHLGEFIDDASKTTKVMFLGMNIGRLKPKSKSIQKYQLMDIRVKIPFIDGFFWEDLGLDCTKAVFNRQYEISPSAMIRNQMDLNQNRDFSQGSNDELMLDRWRLTIVGAELLIKRDTPPLTTQSILNELDEDKGQIHDYGPRVEGGQISFSVHEIFSVLHPLTMSNPLAIIKNAKIHGLLHIVPLNESSKGVLCGRLTQTTAKCHHSKCLSTKTYSESHSSENLSYRHFNSAEKQICGCNYGVQYESSIVPPKIYIDLEIDFNDVGINYGMVLSDAIPKLQEIIKRLTPPSSELPQSNEKTPPQLTWWDNLRFQFHGNFSSKFHSLSFRWLLDSIDRYDWSILLTSKNTCIEHTSGMLNIAMEDVIISVPGSSYHMLKFDESISDQDADNFLSGYSDHCVKERHSLMLVPFFKLNTKFSWNIECPHNTKSSEHHLPYLLYPDEVETDESYPIRSARWDKFERFRSSGVKLSVDLSCSHNSTFATWLALRVDVLPWLVHKQKSSEIRTTESSESDALPKILGLKFKASLSNLQIGAWLDEDDEMSLNESLIINNETITDGICLTIPQAFVNISKDGKDIKLRGPIQAALLNILDEPSVDSKAQNIDTSLHQLHSKSADIDRSVSRHFGVSDLRKLESLTEETDQKILIDKNGRNSHANIHNMNSYKSFECLQFWSTQITDYHYLLEAEQIDIMDESLNNIKMSVCHDVTSGGVLYTENSHDTLLFEEGKRDIPWTVLVLGMRLLWSVDIRDSVMSLVQDLLFTINFMKVNVRGTPQNIAQTPGAKAQDTKEEDLNESINGPDSVDLDIDSEYIETVALSTTQSEEMKSEQVSSLDYLLESNETSMFHHDSNESQSISQDNEESVSNTTRLENMRYTRGENHSSLDNFSLSPADILQSRNVTQPVFESSKSSLSGMIPTLNVHLANSQIQLYSESTGGSVILAIRGAYVEQHKFTRLFTNDFSSENKEFSAESLLWRTRNEYTLEKMEIYSMNTDVDVSAGLQWLELGHVRKTAKPILVRSEGKVAKSLKSISFDVTDETDSDMMTDHEKEVSQSFPQNLEKYEPRDFIIPQLFVKIMNPCTFKTREECHRPPIDLTKEELADCLRKGPPLLLYGDHSLAFDGALDHIDILMDELSFCLDSYQFSTTLDLIRNVLLEPPKPPRQRYYKTLENSNDMTDNSIGNDVKKDTLQSKPEEHTASILDQLIRDWHDKDVRHVKGKKGRKYLNSAARDLLTELEAHQTDVKEPISRRITYTLSKAKWKVRCQDIGKEDVEINLTRFNGQHDFSTDGSVMSDISLEDFRISSLLPNQEAICFPDPTAIVTTNIGVDLSPCQRCGETFDRSKNENNSCRFHAGEFVTLPGERSAQWTCCRKIYRDAPGCVSRPHTGMERAIVLSLESLPRKVDGVTMYKHIEANIYPGVTHSLVIQLTKSLCSLFMAYFIGESDTSSSKHSLVSGFEDIQSESTIPSLSVEMSLQDYESISTDATDKQKMLLGQMSKGVSTRSLVTSSSVDFENDNTISPTKSPEKVDKEVQQEIIFVKRFRVGDINVDVSIGGNFHKFIKDGANVRIAVPAFQNAYKTGPANYFGKKYVMFTTHQVLKSFLKGNMFGKANTSTEGQTNDNTNDTRSKNHHEVSRSGLLLGSPVTRFNIKKNMGK